MKTYLVGGAVRDEILGYPFKEKDWVVVGATVDDMIAAGYQQVGKDFPVFLHPESKEEYALARTERKTAAGYKGFDVHASPDVTLEDDLVRRDLTINAIAKDENGEYIDPYHGIPDIKNKILRHVSDAFLEDPVRILRIARFMARYAHLNFSIADETRGLMKEMVSAGEIDALVPERVWQEMQKALTEKTPTAFITTLRDCGALEKILPELDCLFGVPQPEEHHPEIDTGVHTLMVLEQACLLSKAGDVRFAALVHDLGKGTTPQQEWPRHINHEARGADVVKKVCQRLRIPNEYRDLAERTARFHLHYHRALELKPATVVKTLEQLDAYRKPERFEKFLLASEADARGRTGYENKDFPQGNYFRQALTVTKNIDIGKLRSLGFENLALANKIKEVRTEAITELKSRFN
ncbi:MAG: fused tRNA nucleotidyltransferase/2',3'-cyclic phosphodiesterase/2' nucleotidase/phosphatase Cca [Gammaproteobacteria bacterium]|nr:MAG: fused tRNA nucleotidyltransferase/2',3'-cyclic phosphodiesterase/2' nucleotidase/phosphatase Cca [Gammaproteobacteria bacterium]